MGHQISSEIFIVFQTPGTRRLFHLEPSSILAILFALAPVNYTVMIPTYLSRPEDALVPLTGIEPAYVRLQIRLATSQSGTNVNAVIRGIEPRAPDRQSSMLAITPYHLAKIRNSSYQLVQAEVVARAFVRPFAFVPSFTESIRPDIDNDAWVFVW